MIARCLRLSPGVRSVRTVSMALMSGDLTLMRPTSVTLALSAGWVVRGPDGASPG